jgi:hypothetical protein
MRSEAPYSAQSMGERPQSVDVSRLRLMTAFVQSEGSSPFSGELALMDFARKLPWKGPTTPSILAALKETSPGTEWIVTEYRMQGAERDGRYRRSIQPDFVARDRKLSQFDLVYRLSGNPSPNKFHMTATVHARSLAVGASGKLERFTHQEMTEDLRLNHYVPNLVSGGDRGSFVLCAWFLEEGALAQAPTSR